MTFAEKLKQIRKRFGLTQEQLAKIINVSRQVITKWENGGGLPDISNLQELSKIFGLTIDYLLDNNNALPVLLMRKELDKTKYSNKLFSHREILMEYYPEPWKIFILSSHKKMGKLESILDFFTTGDYFLIKNVSDLSSYYLVKNGDLKLLVNIKNYVLEVVELPTNIDDKKFSYGQNKFVNCGKIKFKKI